MRIELSKPLARNSAAEEFDVRQMKKALNRLGYYAPLEKTGITGIPDAAMFAALKTFQKDAGLPATGAARPGDETVTALNRAVAERPEGSYVWRTAEDERVRASHAELNRTVRSWTDSPDPGEEFNCRCWAEMVASAMGIIQEVISPIHDSRKWTWRDFVNHFYNGNGETVNLSQVGLFADVIEHAKSEIFQRVELQFEEKARSIGNGSFSDSFARAYDFSDVSFSLGNSTVKGNIKGAVGNAGKILMVYGQVEYLFFDQFTDPLSIRQNRTGTSNSDNADPYTEAGGEAYDIVGRWLTEISGSILAKK